MVREIHKSCYSVVDVSISLSKHLLFELILWANLFTTVLSWANHDGRILKASESCLQTPALHTAVKTVVITAGRLTHAVKDLSSSSVG